MLLLDTFFSINLSSVQNRKKFHYFYMCKTSNLISSIIINNSLLSCTQPEKTTWNSWVSLLVAKYKENKPILTLQATIECSMFFKKQKLLKQVQYLFLFYNNQFSSQTWFSRTKARFSVSVEIFLGTLLKISYFLRKMIIKTFLSTINHDFKKNHLCQ